MFFGWEGPERGWGGGGHLFEFEYEGEGGGVGVGTYSRLHGHSLNFSAFRMGAYSRWAHKFEVGCLFE